MRSFRSIVSIPITIIVFIIALIISRALFTLLLSIPYVGKFIYNFARGIPYIALYILSFASPVAASAVICDIISDENVLCRRISLYIVCGICILIPLVLVPMMNSEFTIKSTYTISILLGGAVTAFLAARK